MHYIANRLGSTLSYDTVMKITSLIVREYTRTGRTVLSNVQQLSIAVFSVGNMGTSNHHGLVVDDKTSFGMHLAEIKSVLCIKPYDVTRDLRICDSGLQRHTIINDTKIFIEIQIPGADDVDVTTYVTLFIGAIYRFQHKVATINEKTTYMLTEYLCKCLKDSLIELNIN